MINDYELYFTPYDGQLFNASDGQAEYGSKYIDLKVAHDPFIEGDAAVFYRVVDVDSDVQTNLAIAVFQDDDGAGTNEASVLSATVLKANLTKAKGTVRLGTLKRGDISKRCLRAKVTTTGTAATVGKISVWIGPNSDSVPANAGRTL